MCGVEVRPIAQMDVVDAEYARDAALEAADHVERIERETVLERRARSAPVDRARIGTEHFAHSSTSLLLSRCLPVFGFLRAMGACV